MKKKSVISFLMTIIFTTQLALPVCFAEGQASPYDSLPANGTVIQSTEQFLSAAHGGDYRCNISQIDLGDGSTAVQYATMVKPDCSMDYEFHYPVYGNFANGDVGVISFSARSMMDKDARLDLIYQEKGTWDKIFYKNCVFTDEWQEYNIPIGSTKDLNTSNSEFCFWIGFEPQIFQIKDFKIINYGKQVSYETLTGYSLDSYEGRETGAQWRTEALARIEQYRKGNLHVTAKNADGTPIKNADIDVKMKSNAFNFGTAATALCWQNSYYSQTDMENYQNALKTLFNCGVTENSMKWTDITTGGYTDADNTTAFFEANGMRQRGHCMYWDAEDLLTKTVGDPNNMTKEQISGALNAHVAEIAQRYPDIVQWDVLNEPTVNRFLRLKYGDAVIADLFKTAKANTDAKLYVNELDITGYDSLQVTKIKDIVNDLKGAGAPIDGIGLETHCGNRAASPIGMYNQIQDLLTCVDEISITEYDIDTDDETLAADNLRDMLIMAYSIPQVKAFMTWGFWDGQHWLDNAAFYNRDWTEKEALNVWRQWVKNTWVTNTEGTTNNSGEYATRGYLGTYDVTLTCDGTEYTQEVDMLNNEGLDVEFRFAESGNGMVTKEGVLAESKPVCDNEALFTAVGDVTNQFSSNVSDNNTFAQTDFYGNDCIEFNTGSYAGYANVNDAKISIPVSQAISEGDICQIKFNAEQYWAPDNILKIQFALSDGTNSVFSDVKGIRKNFDLSNFRFNKEYSLFIQADRNYPLGSTVDICLGFNNYQSGVITNLTVTDFGNKFSMDEVKRVLYTAPNSALLDNLECIAGENTFSIAFSAFMPEKKNVDYLVALYNENKLVDIRVLNDIMTDTDETPIPTSFNNVDYTNMKVMAFDDFMSLNPLCGSLTD